MFTYNESAGSFFAWSENHYSDDSSPGEKEIGIQWSPGSTTDDTAPALSEVNFSVSSGHEARFIIEIQGSSTKRFSSKNYTLSLKWSDESNKSTVPIFSPNFDPNDPSTFLPEQQFTLKADIVDSGHSNNTCMGSFINRVTQKFSDSTNTNDDREQYKNFVRNCLEGFPFLLFVGLTTSEGGIDMCNGIQYYANQVAQTAKLEQARQTYIETAQEFGQTITAVLNGFKTKFNVTEEEAQDNIKKYWKET
jgi:hypothetical protein